MRKNQKCLSEAKFLLSFKHKDIGLTLADPALGPGKRLEVGRKLDVLSSNDLALNLAGDLQSALIFPTR